MTRFGLLVLSVLFFAAALVCGWMFHDHYWKWRNCFNELGRCYDPASQDVLLEQAGIAWGGLTVVCLIIAATLVLLRRRN